MTINFPNSPSPNQLYSYDNKTWEWNGVYWEVYSALTSYVSSITFNSYTGVTQPLIYSSITGGTYSGGTLYLVNNSGGTITITGFSTSSSGGTISGDYLPLSGGTVTGGTIFQSGLTANTISATTYLNLPTDIRVTGATYSNNTFTYTNNTGGTFNVLFNTVTGLTVNGNLTVTGTTSSGTISATTYQNLPISGLTSGQNISITGSNGNFTISFTGGTVTGPTRFTNGLTANTISATTYENLPTDVFVTGGTYSDGTAVFTNTTGGTFSVSGYYTGGTDGIFVTGPIAGDGSSGDPYDVRVKETSVAYGNGTDGSLISDRYFRRDFDSGTFYTEINATDEASAQDSIVLYGDGNGIQIYSNDFGNNQSIVQIDSTSISNIVTDSVNANGYFIASAGEAGLGVLDLTGSTRLGVVANVLDNTLSLQLNDGGNYRVILPKNTASIGDVLAISGNPSFGVFTSEWSTISSGGVFTGGTVSGETIFTNGLTANTVTITTIPTLNYTSSQVLTRNTSNGNIEYIPINQIKTNGNNLYLFYNY